MSKKKKIIFGLIALILLITLGFLGWAAKTGKLKFAAKEKVVEPKRVQPQPPVKEHILVKFKPSVSETRKNQIHQKTGGKVKDKIKQIEVEFVQIPPGKGITPESFVETYQGNFKDELEFAEVDQVIPPTLWPNDPYFNYWQLELQWMGGPQAWDITTGDPNLKIAVLDSGCDFTHRDLQGRLVAGWDFWDNDPDPTDAYGHGTWVTGVLGATTNNSFGIAGVSWRNPVLCVRISYTSTTWGLMGKGITYAADRGARAINVSFAGTGYSSTVASAVDYAWSKRAVTVAGAGNSGTSTPHYPAALPRVVGVSGVTGDDVIWYGSNYGSWIDVCAPNGSFTTGLGGSIGTVGGTSISAPFVTGLFGLVFSANPGLTPQQATDVITSTAKDLGSPGFDIYYGWGKIDIFKAVQAASGAQPTTGNITGKITDSSTGIGLSGATITALQSAVSKGQVQTSTDGSYTLSNLPDGTYDLKAEKLNYQTKTQSGVSVTADQTTTINLALTPQPTTGNITGRVTDAATGAGIAQAIVSAYQVGNLIKSTTTLSDGSYTLSNLAAGSYDLTASLSGYQSKTQSGVSVTAGSTITINLALTPQVTQQYGSLTGSVSNTSFNPISGAKITVTNTQTNTSYTTTSNSSGTYTFTNLPVGNYNLKAQAKGGWSTTQSGIQIQAGQITTQNLTLTKKGR